MTIRGSGIVEQEIRSLHLHRGLLHKITDIPEVVFRILGEPALAGSVVSAAADFLGADTASTEASGPDSTLGRMTIVKRLVAGCV